MGAKQCLVVPMGYVPTPLRYVFRIPIFLSSASLKKSSICFVLSVSLSYCLATEGSFWELTSLDLSWSGILSCVVNEKGLDKLKDVNVNAGRGVNFVV